MVADYESTVAISNPVDQINLLSLSFEAFLKKYCCHNTSRTQTQIMNGSPFSAYSLLRFFSTSLLSEKGRLIRRTYHEDFVLVQLKSYLKKSIKICFLRGYGAEVDAVHGLF